MKIFKAFLFIALALVVTSCGDDDAPVVELTNSNLVGTYNVVFLEGSFEETDNSSGVVVARAEFRGDTFTNATFTFNENGSYTAEGSYRSTTTFTVTGEAPSTESEIVDLDDTGNFSVNTNSRTITFDGEVNDVTLFDGTNLYVISNDTEVEDGNTTTFTSEIRLVKQN